MISVIAISTYTSTEKNEKIKSGGGVGELVEVYMHFFSYLNLFWRRGQVFLGW